MTVPLPLPVPLVATVRPKSSPADMMRRLEERYLFAGLFSKAPEK